MSTKDSVREWLPGFKAGDSAAVQRAWEKYYERLVRLAHKVLQGAPQRAADEEDVALSAFKSFYFRAHQGKFPNLDDRDDVWSLLMTITVRKALRARQKEGRETAKRAPEIPNGETEAGQPSPALAALVNDQLRQLIGLLDDPQLRTVALSKLEGYSNSEIADKLGRSVSTVERKLQLIRRIWSSQVPS